MTFTEWRQHETQGPISYDVVEKNGIEVVEVEVSLWRAILDELGFTPLDGPPKF